MATEKDRDHAAPGHAPVNSPTGTVRASLPANHHTAIAADVPAKVMPKDGATAYKVRTKGADNFKRCGIMFSSEPTTVDGASLTDEQKIELLNTPHLVVEEVGGSAPAKKTEK